MSDVESEAESTNTLSNDETFQDDDQLKQKSEDEAEGDGLAEEEKIPDNPLIQEHIPDCLSLLCKTGSGLSHAYVKFDAREKDFTNVDILKQFIHLRYIDLSVNLICDISVFNNLKHLLVLKMDKNNLTSIELEPLPYLQVASFNDNKIETINGFDHPLLEKLSLNSNKINTASGLNGDILTNLTFLELRGNNITSIEGLRIPSLKTLYLAANRLINLNGIDQMINLQILHVRDNQINDLSNFSQSLRNLTYLNLRGNAIEGYHEVKQLEILPSLQQLVLAENKCSEDENYRTEVLIMIRKLERLDKDNFTEDERTDAEDFYEQRRQEELTKEDQGENNENDVDDSSDKDENAD